MPQIEKILAQIPRGVLVGGIVRDALLKRQSGDIDIALPGCEVSAAARALARALKGAAFEMDAEFGVWRVVTKKENLQIDLTAFQGKDLKEDLARRDFTINTLCYPLTSPFKLKLSSAGGKTQVLLYGLKHADIIDNHGGAKDLKQKKVAVTGPRIFKEDPLRMLRAYRTAAELGFKITPQTSALITKDKKLVSLPSGERVREELVRVFNTADSYSWFKEMDDAGLLTALFPALEEQRACAEEYYGKGGVLKHTLLVLRRMDYLLENLAKVYPAYAKKLKPYTDGKKYIYKTAALLHDIAKPATAKVINGRLRFFFHEEEGSKMAKSVLDALRFSAADVRLIRAMIAEHLRPSSLASNDKITDKAVYKFFKDMGETGVPMLLLCWADYASYITDAQLPRIIPAARGAVLSLEEAKKKENNYYKTLRHMQVVNCMLKKVFFGGKKIKPERLLDGKEIMRLLNIPPGPRVGELLDALAEAQVDGLVKTKEDAEVFLKDYKNSPK